MLYFSFDFIDSFLVSQFDDYSHPLDVLVVQSVRRPGYGLKNLAVGVGFSTRERHFLSLQFPDEFQGTPSLLIMSIRGFFPGKQQGLSIKMTTHFNLMLRFEYVELNLRSSWRGTQLSAGITLLLPYSLLFFFS